jgi:hypothetical protein
MLMWLPPLHPSTSHLLRRINLIQYTIRRDLGQHHAIGNTQQRIARPTVQVIDLLMDHHIHRSQRFYQIDHQGLVVDLRVDGKKVTGFTPCGFNVGYRGDVIVEGALGELIKSN